MLDIGNVFENEFREEFDRICPYLIEIIERFTTSYRVDDDGQFIVCHDLKGSKLDSLIAELRKHKFSSKFSCKLRGNSNGLTITFIEHAVA